MGGHIIQNKPLVSHTHNRTTETAASRFRRVGLTRRPRDVKVSGHPNDAAAGSRFAPVFAGELSVMTPAFNACVNNSWYPSINTCDTSRGAFHW